MGYVFLDRDGTLIRHIPYLCEAGRVELLPGVVPGLRELLRSGCTLFLHSNQSGIGRGYFSREQALACNDAMLEKIGLGQQLFADVRICPEVPGEGEIGYRKPSPRYAQEMMAKYAVDVRKVCYIGDNVSDLLTAKNVGCAGVGVNTGVHDLHSELRQHGLSEFPVFDNFLDATLHAVSHFRRLHAAG